MFSLSGVGVVEAPATSTPEPTTIQMPAYETYFIATAAVMVLAIAIATVLLLRKRP